MKHPKSYALSVDLFGPVPAGEAGRDESCVTGKCVHRYGLIGAFRLPKSILVPTPRTSGVEDLCKLKERDKAELPDDVDVDFYQPSENEDDLFPELGFDSGPPEDFVPFEGFVGALEAPDSLAELHDDLPQDDEAWKQLVHELETPVEQVVLRYFIPLKSKNGPEVAEAVQTMIIKISTTYPVRSIHHDPGTEFASTALTRWLADKGIRISHSLPTDKRANGLAERTVGWFKSRIRTLLKSASFPIHWWPLAGRWAAHKHNCMILDMPSPPGFGQTVLHRVKRPADGSKQLMDRWIQARYAAPHRTITDGHVLVTEEGKLVASKGFKANTIDPNELEGLNLPIVQEQEIAPDVPPSEAPDVPIPDGKSPEKRVRGKSRVSFIDAEDQGQESLDALASALLLDDDVSDAAFRRLVDLILKHERPTGDRRSGVDEKFVFGAFCHGGQRGVTNLCKRRPITTHYLNHFLRRRAELSAVKGPCEWSALMLMPAAEIETHKDVRNEWHTENTIICVPGTYELVSGAAMRLTGQVVQFDARVPHSVQRSPDWFLVGYTPLGTAKLGTEGKMFLRRIGFRFGVIDDPGCNVRVVKVAEDSPNEKEENLEAESSFAEGVLIETCPEGGLADDEQEDSVTPTVGWGYTSGEPGNIPSNNLEETDLYRFLDDRGVAWLCKKLAALGIEVAADLVFLYEEDLVENGFSPDNARRIMSGVHPKGTVRPDNPNLCSLTTGEVQLLDRQHRKLPWVFQNRTLGHRSPDPPVKGIGVKGHDNREGPREEDWIVSEERRLNEERWIEYTQIHTRPASSAQTFGQPEQPSASSGDPAPSSGFLGLPQPNEGFAQFGVPMDHATVDEEYAWHAMMMQGLWDEEEDSLPPGYPPEALQGPTGSRSSSSADPNTKADSSKGPFEPSCRVVRCEDEGVPGEPERLSSCGSQRVACTTVQATSRIGIPTDDPLSIFAGSRLPASSEFRVHRVDESFYTKNVEELLEELTDNLKVVHNVSPEEIRRHMPKWIPAAKTEVEALEGMAGIRRLYGEDASKAIGQPGTQVLPAKTVFTVKPGNEDTKYRRKCRVVGCGSFEEKDPNLELYASGVPAEALRTVLVEAAVRGFSAFITDIKNAFLLAPLPSEMEGKILLKPPRILEQMEITVPGEYWEVCKAVYGLRQSPKWWSEFRDTVLRAATWEGATGKNRFCQSRVEGNVWKILNDADQVVGFVIIYVDDLMFLTSRCEAEKVYTWLKGVWQCTPLEEATDKSSVTFLGVEVSLGQDNEGRKGFLLSQGGYIDELLRTYNLSPKHRTPIPREWTKEAPVEETGYSADSLRRAQKITGELLWLTQRTRVDAAYAVSLLGSWCVKAPEFVMRLGLRLLHFLGSTRDLRLSLIPASSEKRVVVYTDASFAPYGSHSVSGILVTFHGRSVTWKAKKQALVSLSTAEAELISACEGVVMAQSTEALILELTQDLETKRLLVDNLAAIALAEGSGSQRTRHLRVRSSFVRDLVDRRELEVDHCPGELQLADLLTKILPGPRHQLLTILVGLSGKDPIEPQVAALSQVQVTTQQADPNQIRVKLMMLVLLMQLSDSEAADEEGGLEPLSLELSAVAIMMMLSVLFIWETSKFCFLRWCRHEDHRVQTVRVDEDDDVYTVSRTRRERRQEAVRRAIHQETAEVGLRRRREQQDEFAAVTNQNQPPVVQVNVGEAWNSGISPPLPRFASSSSDLESRPTQVLSGNSGFSSSCSMQPRGSTPTNLTQDSVSSRPRSSMPSGFIPPSLSHDSSGLQGNQDSSVPRTSTSAIRESERPASKEIGTQTDFPRGLTHIEMREVTLMTTSSRTPGAVHLFPECHALRGVTSLNRRSFCRYCLTAAERSGI